jgi:hypothetical protein
MRISSILLVSCLVMLIVSSCKKEGTLATAPSTFDYVPANAGHWVVYDVDSIVHADNDGETDDSVRYFHFQIKEVISSTFKDGEGRQAQRIERYHRANDSEEWIITNVWTSTVTSNRVERMEDNVRFIPVAFPIGSNITWNGNALNTLGEQDYTYDGFHEALSIGNFSFDSTLTVLKADDDNFVERIYAQEKYAVHIGRIYKADQDLVKNGGQVVSGLDYTETIADYGN